MESLLWKVTAFLHKPPVQTPDPPLPLDERRTWFIFKLEAGLGHTLRVKNDRVVS